VEIKTLSLKEAADSRLLGLPLAPIVPDFSVDLADRKFALAVLTGRRTNRGENFLFWREGFEKFLDTFESGS
jgi:hypothetical protein